MWIKYKTASNLMTAEMWKDAFEAEGLINVDIFTTDSQIWLNRLARYLQPITKAVD